MQERHDLQVRTMGCFVGCWAALKELLCIYRKMVRKICFYLCVSLFLLPTSSLYFWDLHTADAICKLPLQVSVKLLTGGEISQKRMKMKESARQYLAH